MPSDGEKPPDESEGADFGGEEESPTEKAMREYPSPRAASSDAALSAQSLHLCIPLCVPVSMRARFLE
eukprot:15320457-Alexandrium_andersonii.AAC.1